MILHDASVLSHAFTTGLWVSCFFFQMSSLNIHVPYLNDEQNEFPRGGGAPNQ